MADYAQIVQQAIDQEIATLQTQQQRQISPPQRRAPSDEELAGFVAPPTQVAAPAPAPPPMASPGAPAPAMEKAKEASDQFISDDRREENGPIPAPKPIAPTTSALATGTIVEALDERIDRLQLVRTWIGEDGELARLIDTVIGQQVRASEQRQARFNVVMSVLSLIAGWLLSAVAAPAILGGIFHR